MCRLEADCQEEVEQDCAPSAGLERRDEAAAPELLNRLNQLHVLNWRQKFIARSQPRLAIKATLDTGLPRAYDKPLYEKKCSALFGHVVESYSERDAGICAAA